MYMGHISKEFNESCRKVVKADEPRNETEKPWSLLDAILGWLFGCR